MGEKYFIVPPGKSVNDRLRISIKAFKGKVKYFMVQYEIFLNNEWIAVVRYDLAHGFFHRDVMNPKGEKEKQVIVINNLEDALNYAQQDLKDRWEFYKDLYLKQIKK